MMLVVSRLVGGFGLALYTCGGIHLYTILVSRTKSDVLRLLLFLLCVALLIVLPLFGWGHLMDGVGRSWSRSQRNVMVLAVFFSWMGPVWGYLILNRRVLTQRLAARKDPQST